MKISGTKISLKKLQQTNVRERKLAKKLLKEKLEKEKMLKEIIEALETQKADKLQTQTIARKVARSILDPMRKVTVQVNGDVTDFSAIRRAQEQASELSVTDSIWAPWSKLYRKK